MRSTRFTIIKGLGIAVVIGLGACSGSGDGPTTGTGGSGATGTAGTTGSAGTTGGGGVVGSGGTVGSGGIVGAAGTTGSGHGGTTGSAGAAGGGNTSGAAGSSGSAGASGVAGNSGAAGSATPGTGGDATGGVTGAAGGGGRGGAIGSGGRAGGAGGRGGAAGAGTAGSGGAIGSGGSGGMTGGGGSGACQKGQTKGSDVAVLGESFYAISPQYIVNRIQDNARKAGSLGSSDTYHNVAVSGQNMNYIATTEWTAATANGGMPKWIIMDGGGIDCLNGGGATCSSCANTFKTLLGKMGTAGVKEVIYTRYPEPGSPPGSNASLKGCLDGTMPMMQTTCEGSTSPKCHWVDLRPVWQTGDVLSDGLHPTQSGGNHVGDLVWSEMMKECMAQ
jgi:hypothetical protein